MKYILGGWCVLCFNLVFGVTATCWFF